MAEEPKLVRYDAMVTAIEQAASVDEAKEIRAKAVALAAYARQANNRDNERKCCQIRIRAERRCGALLRETVRPKGKSHVAARDMRTPTLEEHGISRDQSSDWQRLAAISDDRFEEELSRPGLPSTEQILHSTYPPKPEPSPIANVDPSALELWGVLCDFEQKGGLLGRDQKQLLSTMTEPMREDTLRLAPVVAHWLGGIEEESHELGRKAQLPHPGTVQLTGRAEDGSDLSG